MTPNNIKHYNIEPRLYLTYENTTRYITVTS